MNEVAKTNEDYHKNNVLKWLQVQTLKLSTEEQEQFLTLCVLHKLNPAQREIYAIKYGNTFNIVVSYEVYIKRALASGLCDGFKTELEQDSKGGLKCTAIVYRKDMKEPVIHSCLLSEYNQNNNMWKTKTTSMLKKVTLSQAFRLAFADKVDGLPYSEEELPLKPETTVKTAEASLITDEIVDKNTADMFASIPHSED